MPRLLDVLIATHGPSGLRMVERMQLPQVEGVNYVVTWQQPPSQWHSQLQERPDVEIHTSDSIGLSRNRNLGLELSRAPICLIADNDVRYSAEQLIAVIEAFDEHPDMDLAQFRYEGATKTYPREVVDLSAAMPRNHNICSIELAFRRERIGQIRFDTHFGLGARYGHGEEIVFITDCIRAGLRFLFIPKTITRHKGTATGGRMMNAADMRGQGALLRYVYGPLKSLPRIPLTAFRDSRRGRMPLLKGMVRMLQGYLSLK